MISPSGLTFFGLTPTYRVNLFTQIHGIVFHGKGGYDYDTVYNLPIWLRRFTFQNINEFYEKEKAEMEKASGKSKLSNDSPKGPAIKQADYNTPARK